MEQREPSAINILRLNLIQGMPWPLALLAAMGEWILPDEIGRQKRHFQYIIHGEAFDWLVLAERLCATVATLISQEDQERLLFLGRFSEEINQSQLKRLLGPGKYGALLNYWYGIIVEEALLLTAEEEIRKERLVKGLTDSEEVSAQAYIRIYGKPEAVLLQLFWKQTGSKGKKSLTLTELKTFTYWLSKYRLQVCVPPRVASDMRKGLEKLHELRDSNSFL